MEETHRSAAERIARRVTDLVGDGCVVRLADVEQGSLTVAAVEHRDPERRERLTLLAEAPPQSPTSGWPGQALAKNLAFRVEHAAAADAVGVVMPFSLQVHAAVVAPLRRGGEPIGTVVALRDSVDLPYGLREQQLVEELARGDAPYAAGQAEPDPARVLEHAAVGLWATDMDGVTTYANEALTEMLGVPASELVGAAMGEYLDEEPALVQARRSLTVERRDHRLARPDGGELWVSMTSTPLTDAEGRRTGTISTLTEVTERKRVEVELRLRAAAHEAVAELAERALAGDDLDALMRRAVLSAAEILGAEYATIAEVSPGRDDAVPRVVLGWDQSLVGRRIPIPANSPADLCLDDDEPVVVGDYDRAGAIQTGSMAAAADARSAICVAIAGGAGVLALSSPRPEAFAGQNLSFLRSLAAVLGSRWTTAPAPLAAVPA